MKYRQLILLAVTAAIASSLHAQVVDSFSYASQSEARGAWTPSKISRPVQVHKPGSLLFPVSFSSGQDRNYWDKDQAINLERSSSIELDLTCDRPDVMRSLAVYFRSGDGWYIWNKSLKAAGRQKLNIQKSDFKTEGAPAGWHKIDKVRISPWKAQAADTQLILHGIAGRNERLFVIQATDSAPNATERYVARRTTDRISGWLEAGGLAHSVVTEDQTDKACREASVIVLPYNPQIPAEDMKALKAFTKRGGKLIVFYSSDSNLAKLMGVKLGDVTKTRDIAKYRAITFTKEAPPGVPSSVHQQSWNIGRAHPSGKKNTIIAYWADAANNVSSDAAVIATQHGYWFTHILLDDDKIAKQRMLTALLASLDSTLWKDAAEHALRSAGRVDGWADARTATAAIEKLAVGHPDRETILVFTKRIKSSQTRMEQLFRKGRYGEAVAEGYKLSAALAKAYALSQRPVKNEIRAVWDHDGTGWFPGDWDRTAKLLADSGINTIFVNATWAGLAHYPSEYLPESYTHRYYRDQLEQCVKAARKHGLEVHAWIVCWYLENAPEAFTKPLRYTGRLQETANGKERLWLNPAHPVNVKHHLNVIEEILNNYDVDGIHLDYIRFPDKNACFSSYTRQAFEKDAGVKVGSWPKDVESSGIHHQAFVKWRAGVITDAVKQSRETIRRVKPGAQLSAAVWGLYPQIVGSIGQDWLTWIKKDYVDFVCPMNYANDLYGFTSLLDRQLALPGTEAKIIPGIGVTASESQLRSDKVIEQILALRKRGVQGFALFDLSQSLVDEVLPVLRMGVTKPLSNE